MKKRSLKLIFITLIILYLTTILTNFVSAQNTILDPIRDLFTFQSDLAISTNIAKYLFWLLVTLLVWTALDAAGFTQNQGIRWGISIIVGFLGVSYLTPNEVWLALTSYGALGMTLLFILPIIILLLFTFRIVKAAKSTGVVLQLTMWWVYFAFLAYRFVYGLAIKQLDIEQPSTWVFGAVILFTAFMTLNNKWVIKKLGKTFVGYQIEQAENTEALAAAVTAARAKTAREERPST